MQTTCVDQGFLQVYEELKSLRPQLEVKHGRIQNIYLVADMKPPPEITDLESTEYSGKSPVSDFGKEEKGKTYVISADNAPAHSDADDNTQYAVEMVDQDPPVDFDEKTLDEEVSAVTGVPKSDSDDITQVQLQALVDDRASAGTLTPDI